MLIVFRLIENLDENVAPEYKDVFVRRVVMRYLQKTPTPDNDEDADNLLLMYRIMVRTFPVTTPACFRASSARRSARWA